MDFNELVRTQMETMHGKVVKLSERIKHLEIENRELKNKLYKWTDGQLENK